MLGPVVDLWRMFRPGRSEWAHAARIRGRVSDPPGQETVLRAIDDALFEDGDDELVRLTYTSSWDVDKGSFHLDVFAGGRTTLDAAVKAVVEDEVLATCDLEIQIRWSDGA